MNLQDFTKSELASLCPELISEDSFAQLRAFSDLLPATLFSKLLSFEFVSHEPIGRTDFGFKLLLTENSTREIRESFESVSANFITNNHWVNFFNLLKAFENGDLNKQTCPSLALVFDFSTSSSKLLSKCPWPPDPNVYFFPGPAHDFHLIETLRGFFITSKMPQSMTEILRKCYENCATLNLKIANMGILCARSLDSVRLYIAGDALKPSLKNYLSLVGYPYDVGPLLNLLKTLESYFSEISVGFDIGTTISDRIGVECYLPDLPVSETKKAWGEILSILGSLSMLSSEKKTAFTNWMSLHMIKGSGSCAENLLERKINHIKFLYNKHGTISAKIYLMPSIS